MKIASGVEWAAHACTLLAALPEGWTLRAEAVAEYFDVPPAYLAKQMQALARAGIVISQRGAAGGYSLARPPADVSLWDITEALEGREPSFKCQEIRQNGPCGAAKTDCKRPCGIAASFHAAEVAFREHLKGVNLVHIMMDAAEQGTPEKMQRIYAWMEEKASKP